jgi:hypothetical protein
MNWGTISRNPVATAFFSKSTGGRKGDGLKPRHLGFQLSKAARLASSINDGAITSDSGALLLRLGLPGHPADGTP